jgi:alpha-beta hydrolase superfamily lysophospholipase
VPDEQHGLNRKAMKKQTRRKPSEDSDTMRPEYDFSKGVRGKHAARYAQGINVVVLEPDVAREFRTTEQVNETLRAVSKLLQQHRKRSSRKTA